MFYWFIPIAVTVAILLFVRVRLLKKYEYDNALLSSDRIEALENTVGDLVERIKTLETIESNTLLEEANEQIQNSPESVSSHRTPISR